MQSQEGLQVVYISYFMLESSCTYRNCATSIWQRSITL